MKSKNDLAKEVFSKFDIRGIYPDRVSEDLVSEVAKTLSEKVFIKGRVVVGHDARTSSPSLYKKAIETLRENAKLEIIEVGLVSTPMMTFLVNDLKADGGIMITASHNPKEYNGIKAMRKGGDPISGEDIYAIL